MQNNGRLAWLESKVKLVNIGGNIYCETKSVKIPFTDANDLVEIEIELIAPNKPGNYLSEWVLAYDDFLFGPRIWCAIEVVDNKAVDNLINVDVTSEHERVSKLTQPQIEFTFPLVPQKTRKFSTSTEIDEKIAETSYDHAFSNESDDENEFVIVPDCLNLAKKWEPNQTSFNDLCASFDSDNSNKKHDVMDQTNSTTTLMLVNELLLIPKYEKNNVYSKKLVCGLKPQENLMTFSVSLHDETSESIENLKFDTEDSSLNETVKNDDLLIFSQDFSNLNNKNKAVETAKGTSNDVYDLPVAVNVTQVATTARLNTPVSIVQNLMPSAPIFNSLQSEYPSLDSADRLISMGFANRSLNNKLLNKHNDDINKVIEELLARNENDWASHRH